MLNKILLYFHTLRYLKWRQFKYRIYYFLRNKIRSKTSFSYPVKVKVKLQSVVRLKLKRSLPAAASIHYTNNTFSFLNLQKKFENSIDWNDKTHGKLWTYNLNYFEFLHVSTLTKEEGKALINDYIQKIEESIDGLEPYPTSLRVLHWIKFLTYHNIQDEVINKSLYNQLWTLANQIEYHVLGNHLLENSFGLLFGAYYFKDENLYELAKKILISELKEQILADGGHFELSPMYHQLMLYRMLDCYNLVKNNYQFGQELLLDFKKKAEVMMGWLAQISFRDGSIPLLNDSAFDINPTTEELIEYGKRLGIASKFKHLGESGYRKFNSINYECIIDIGHIGPDYVPGHAHSDIFNFIVYSKGKPFIVDTGTSTYTSSDRRNIERSTKAHNTVQIGNYEQSEMWSSFRVARRASPIILEDSTKSIEAKVSYATNKKTVHYRQFTLDDDEIIICDHIGKDKIGKAFIHFHPTIEVYLEGDKVLTSLGILQLEGHQKTELVDYKYARTFNQLYSAKKVVIHFKDSLTTRIIIK